MLLNLPFRLNGNSVKLLENVLNNFQYRNVGNFALDALLDNGLTFITRKLFGRYGMEGFGFLDSFASAKLGFNKLFEKFRYCFGQPLMDAVTKYRNVRFGGKFIKIESVAAAFIARFTLFFGESFFTAAVKTRRGVTGKTFAKALKSCKRKKARWTRDI
ncbi:hypothetical protein GGTG_07137 [Gaeumannomyces tritici R3-111a-1]|uniref:Uncharacterized protein n=1 Tax=Gaeumannomyces tritici (strain R3-111a-1) TaxID=644352 RepID=J3P0U2_GAET3|nr:hypothetical protein GGTG_07137 [Gaeumannomyces tritici R3-111a-1]EJT77225.1 hypothetical protein GGTG_07137 [Gaeumannomyces tritici R3-111a-1]